MLPKQAFSKIKDSDVVESQLRDGTTIQDKRHSRQASLPQIASQQPYANKASSLVGGAVERSKLTSRNLIGARKLSSSKSVSA